MLTFFAKFEMTVFLCIYYNIQLKIIGSGGGIKDFINCGARLELLICGIYIHKSFSPP